MCNPGEFFHYELSYSTPAEEIANDVHLIQQALDEDAYETIEQAVAEWFAESAHNGDIDDDYTDADVQAVVDAYRAKFGGRLV